MSLIGPRNLLCPQGPDQKQIPLPLCGIGMTGSKALFSNLKFPAVVDGHRRCTSMELRTDRGRHARAVR